MTTIDLDFLQETLQRLIHVPSPTGDTERATDLCRQLFCVWDDVLAVKISPKGVLTATWNGEKNDAPRAITAHVDTLGAQVSFIKENGRLQLSQLGSFDWTAIENEGVSIQTQSGLALRGTVLFSNESYHVHSNDDRVDKKPRTQSAMEVRVDAKTQRREETRALGIEVGDFIFFDPRYEENNGFIRSRFLDDKACLACVFTAVKALHDAGLKPAQRTTFHVSNYEEVCHGGASGLPKDLVELLAVDVAPIGRGQNSNEYLCSLCMADTEGPYDIQMNRKLRRLASEIEIELRPDIYPQFASDAKAYWRAGGDARVALIGPGTDATHGLERTHLDALAATTRLIVAYLLDDEK